MPDLSTLASVDVRLSGLSGELLRLRLPAKTSIVEVKRLVQSQQGIASYRQRLLLADRFLDDRDELAELCTVPRQLSLTLVQRSEEAAKACGFLEAQRSLEALGRNWGVFSEMLRACPELRDMADVMGLAVSVFGLRAFQEASASLRASRRYVLGVMRGYARRGYGGHALEFASSALSQDVEVVTAAVEHSYWGETFQYAHDDLKKDKVLVARFLQVSPGVLQFAAEELRDDPDVVLKAMRASVETFMFASHRLRHERSFLSTVLETIPRSGKVVLFYTEQASPWKTDRDFMTKLLRNQPEALLYAHECIRNDPDMRALVQKTPSAQRAPIA